MNDRYYLPLTKAVLWALSAVVAVTAAGFAGIEAGADSGVREMTVKHIDVFDIINEQRVRFVAEHGVADPAALVASVRHSPMANLLISIAIEESRGDPVAVGAAGERGAWQVIASNWGSVPKDLHGQASQAEKIISVLLDRCNGNKIKALAWYNGGTAPPGKSYRYAKRILKRAGYLQVAVNYLPPNGDKLRISLPESLGNSWLL